MRETNKRFLLIIVLMLLSFTFYAISSEESVSASSFDNIKVDYSSDKVAEVTLSNSKLTFEQSVEILVKSNQKENITRITSESSGFSIESETIKNERSKVD
jgi:hypothetical protein